MRVVVRQDNAELIGVHPVLLEMAACARVDGAAKMTGDPGSYMQGRQQKSKQALREGRQVG